MNLSSKKRKIFITLGVIIMVLGGAMVYMNHRNRTLSPAGKEVVSLNDLTVTVVYSRPSVRDRIVFGTEEEEALQPWGQYWRLGANEATEITFSEDVLLGEKPLNKGSYKIYAYPGKEAFKLVINSSLGDWGNYEPDHSKDLMEIEVETKKNEHTEQFTIELKALQPESDGILMQAKFADVLIELPIRPQ